MVYINIIQSKTSKFTRAANISLIAIGFLTILLLYVFDYMDITLVIPIALLCLFFLVVIVKFIRSCLKNEFIINGNLILKDDSIIISTSKTSIFPISITDIDSIVVKYYGFLGESYYIRTISFKDGNKNYISIATKTQSFECEFFLANEAQYYNLIRQLLIYRNQGLCVSLTNEQDRDILLKLE